MRIPEIVRSSGSIVYAEGRALVTWNGSLTLNIWVETSLAGEYKNVDVRSLSDSPISIEHVRRLAADFYADGE